MKIFYLEISKKKVLDVSKMVKQISYLEISTPQAKIH